MRRALRYLAGPICLGVFCGICNAIFDIGWAIVLLGAGAYLIGYIDGDLS